MQTNRMDGYEEPRKSLVRNPFPHLLQQKITIPGRVNGYVHRNRLVERANPLKRRLTVLRATAGFGKTTLLSECCREIRRRGIPTAWISLDSGDSEKVLDVYIAFAIHEAGLRLTDPEESKVIGEPKNRTQLIVQYLQSYRKRLVIAFDEIEQLSDPDSIALLNFLAHRGPPNLHIAFSGREIPIGLDVTNLHLSGNAEIIDSKELRFSEPEIAKFFNLKLTRSTLLTEIHRSAGWPFALRVAINSKKRNLPLLNENIHWNESHWIESRLFSSLSSEDREFVLDLSVFDWIDIELVDEVLNRNDSSKRLESLEVLEGLLGVITTERGTVWQLHPIVQEHCSNQLYNEDRERFRRIHNCIANALSKKNLIVPAMRHAIDSDDPALAGEILQRGGGVRIWTRQGLPELSEANRMLTEDVIDRFPRLKLVRSIELVMRGRPHDATMLYRECPHPTDVKTRGELDSEYAVENALVRGALALYGGNPTNSDWIAAFPNSVRKLEKTGSLDPYTRGTLEYVHCVTHFLRAEFEPALSMLESATQHLYGTHYVAFYGNVVQGQIAFIQGRPQDAKASYQRAMRAAKNHFLQDPVALLSCQIVRQELTLECSPSLSVSTLDGFRNFLKQHGMPYSLFATASNMYIDTRLLSGNLNQATEVLDDLLGFLRGHGYRTFARLLAALKINVLLIDGRVAEAQTGWQSERFPERPVECLDLANQSWREMEAISEARVRLLIALKRYGEGRDLIRAWRSICTKRGLKRTQFRVLTLSATLEKHAGEIDRAVECIHEYVEQFVDCPYAWPLLRESSECVTVLKWFQKVNKNSRLQTAATELLRLSQQLDYGKNKPLSAREIEVLTRLEGSRDKQIAHDLGISVYGVRYHLRGVFSKLRVNNRIDAIHRAREQGYLPK